MWTIARFNWPYYLAALVGLIGSIMGFLVVEDGWMRLALGTGGAGCLYFPAGSLGVSHWVYDRSDLYRWDWLRRILPIRESGTMVLCHSGFDEVSGMLGEEFREMEMIILDHYDPVVMSEPSIGRAREIFPPGDGTLAAPFDDWPIAEKSADVILGILAIHELRTVAERAGWFREAAGCLKENGRIVIAEHARDLANFVAFGPGFLHFHSARAWRESWEGAGLGLVRELRVTPFVRVFVLGK